MKIALIGYGKMGKAIEKIAISRGHEIVLKIGSTNIEEFTAHNLSQSDVAIEFSKPHLAFDNISKCIKTNIPVVCGTTAWQDQLLAAYQLVNEYKGAFIQASNFSLGVNLFFNLNEYLAKLMNAFPQYTPEITEIHHTAKLDAPSGTAITLAEGLIKNNPNLQSWTTGKSNDENLLGIISERIDPAPGTHIISYHSDIDTLEIKHEAHSREGFALGAVIAAEWLKGKQGVFTMKDVLGL